MARQTLDPALLEQLTNSGETEDVNALLKVLLELKQAANTTRSVDSNDDVVKLLQTITRLCPNGEVNPTRLLLDQIVRIKDTEHRAQGDSSVEQISIAAKPYNKCLKTYVENIERTLIDNTAAMRARADGMFNKDPSIYRRSLQPIIDALAVFNKRRDITRQLEADKKALEEVKQHRDQLREQNRPENEISPVQNECARLEHAIQEQHELLDKHNNIFFWQSLVITALRSAKSSDSLFSRIGEFLDAFAPEFIKRSELFFDASMAPSVFAKAMSFYEDAFAITRESAKLLRDKDTAHQAKDDLLVTKTSEADQQRLLAEERHRLAVQRDLLAKREARRARGFEQALFETATAVNGGASEAGTNLTALRWVPNDEHDSKFMQEMGGWSIARLEIIKAFYNYADDTRKSYIATYDSLPEPFLTHYRNLVLELRPLDDIIDDILSYTPHEDEELLAILIKAVKDASKKDRTEKKELLWNSEYVRPNDVKTEHPLHYEKFVRVYKLSHKTKVGSKYLPAILLLWTKGDSVKQYLDNFFANRDKLLAEAEREAQRTPSMAMQ